jgi:hypothetical protein
MVVVVVLCVPCRMPLMKNLDDAEEFKALMLEKRRMMEEVVVQNTKARPLPQR